MYGGFGRERVDADARMETGEQRMEWTGKERPADTPLSKKWTDMDEVQYQARGSPRKILESVLEQKRWDRLVQAGLASSENTAVPQHTRGRNRSCLESPSPEETP